MTKIALSVQKRQVNLQVEKHFLSSHITDRKSSQIVLSICVLEQFTQQRKVKNRSIIYLQQIS